MAWSTANGHYYTATQLYRIFIGITYLRYPRLLTFARDAAMNHHTHGVIDDKRLRAAADCGGRSDGAADHLRRPKRIVFRARTGRPGPSLATVFYCAIHLYTACPNSRRRVARQRCTLGPRSVRSWSAARMQRRWYLKGRRSCTGATDGARACAWRRVHGERGWRETPTGRPEPVIRPHARSRTRRRPYGFSRRHRCPSPSSSSST